MTFIVAFILLSTAPAHKCLLLVYSTKLAWHATWRRTKGEAAQGTSSHQITKTRVTSTKTGVMITPFSLAGGAKDQSNDDGVRYNHGRIPTTGRQSQLLPNGRLQSCRHQVRHRLPHRRDREAG